jgi:hypothetical protein
VSQNSVHFASGELIVIEAGRAADQLLLGVSLRSAPLFFDVSKRTVGIDSIRSEFDMAQIA